MAFNGDVMCGLAAQFLALAEKQSATGPLMLGHRLMGVSLASTGDIAAGRAHLDQAIALYDPGLHRPLATRFGQDVGVAALSYRSFALWVLGYPDAALRDADDALRKAREIGQAATLMYALDLASIPYTLCGNYVAAAAQAQEVVALAEEKGSPLLKAFGVMNQGSVLALASKASDAIEMFIISGISVYRPTRLTCWLPLFLPRLARVHAELGQFKEAWRGIGQATKLVGNNQGNLVRGGDSPHCWRNRPDVARAGCGESRKTISSGRSKSRVHSRRNPGSCAQPRAWRGFGASKGSGTRPENFSLRSTAGSPRASTRWT